jgi:hypothetical protein
MRLLTVTTLSAIPPRKPNKSGAHLALAVRPQDAPRS